MFEDVKSTFILFFYADSIETNIITAADNVESGNQQLNAAASYQVSVILKEEWNDMQKLIQNFALFHQIDRKLCACEPFLSSDSLTVKFDLMLNCIKRVENQCIGSTAGETAIRFAGCLTVCYLYSTIPEFLSTLLTLHYFTGVDHNFKS